MTLHDVYIEDMLYGLSEISYESINGNNIEEDESITLAPGDVLIASASYQVKQRDMDNESLINTVKAIGISPKMEEVQDVDDVLVEGEPAPSISIEKHTDKEEFSVVGELIKYIFVVRNTGNMTLRDVQVTDTLEGLSEVAYMSINGKTIGHQSAIVLAPGDVLVAEATYEITQKDLNRGKRYNLAIATGQTILGESVQDEDDVEITGDRTPSFTVIKSSSEEVFRSAGDRISYSVKAINTGNITLHNVEIKDEMEGLTDVRYTVYDGMGNLLEDDVKNGAVSLDSGQYMEMTAFYIIKESDIERGGIENIALGKAIPEGIDGEDIPGQEEEELESEDISNHSIVRTLRIVKVDKETGNPLSGAVFEVADEFGETVVLTTNKDGEAILENLFLGTYYIKEITAPTGYVLEDRVHEILIEGAKDMYFIEIANQAITNENLPGTGENLQSMMFRTLGIMMVGLGYYGLRLKRKHA